MWNKLYVNVRTLFNNNSKLETERALPPIDGAKRLLLFLCRRCTDKYYLCRVMDSNTSFHTLLSSDLGSIFYSSVGGSLTFNLPDFSPLSAESGRYCSPFFSLSYSDSNQTLPLLSHCCFNYWSSQVHAAHLSAFFLLGSGKIEARVSFFSLWINEWGPKQSRLQEKKNKKQQTFICLRVNIDWSFVISFSVTKKRQSILS